MAYCPECGVELEREAAECPLCRAAIGGGSAPASGKVKTQNTGMALRHLIFSAASFLLLSAFLLILMLNITRDGEITWSRYPLVSLAFAWLLISILLFFVKLPWLAVLMSSGVITAFLALLDAFGGPPAWFLPLGLPITAASCTALLLACVFVRFLSGALLPACLMMLAAVFCMGLELIVSGYLGSPELAWSLVVLLGLTPTAGFLFYYHCFLRKRVDLVKFIRL